MQFDIAWQDIFTPFNCRELQVCLFSLDKHYRKSPEYRVFMALIEKMWPDLLYQPINPHKINQSQDSLSKFKQHIKNGIKYLLAHIKNFMAP